MKLNNATVKSLAINGKNVVKLTLEIKGKTYDLFTNDTAAVIGEEVFVTCQCGTSKLFTNLYPAHYARVYLCSISDNSVYSEWSNYSYDESTNIGVAKLNVPEGQYYVVITLNNYRDIWLEDPITVVKGADNNFIVSEKFFTGNNSDYYILPSLFTSYHSWKEDKIVEEVSQEPENYIVFANISDIHGQFATNMPNGDDSGNYIFNEGPIENAFAQVHKLLKRVRTAGASAPLILYTGDTVGRIKTGTSSTFISRDNQNYDDLVSNLNAIKKYDSIYRIYYGDNESKTLFSMGNHDARAYEASDKTIEDAIEVLKSLNPGMIYPSTTNASGYYVDETDKIVFIYTDLYKYDSGDDEMSHTEFRSFLSSLGSTYSDYKFVIFGHEPIAENSENLCVNHGFYDDITTEKSTISGYTSTTKVSEYLGGANKIICSLHGHQHANACHISYGYPIVQQQPLGNLNINDGGSHRHNFYDATNQLGFTTDSTEENRRQPAAYTFHVWLYNKRTNTVVCRVLGVGPDEYFERNGNEVVVRGFTHVIAPEYNGSETDWKCQYVSDPRWNSESVANEVLKLSGDKRPGWTFSEFSYSAYAYQCDCPRKNGVLQTPFALKGQYYIFAYYTKNSNTGKYTFLGHSDLYPPIEDEYKFSNKNVTVYILTDENCTVKLNGEVGRSITVPKGTDVTYEVEREGYFSETGTIEAPTWNEFRNIDLEEIREQRLLTINAENGSVIVTPNRPGNSFNDGTLLTVAFSPNADYKLKKATLVMNGESTEYTEAFTFTITADATINAEFESDTTPWIEGTSVTVQGIEIKYAFFQCDSKLDNIDFSTYSLTFPEDWSFPYCMFCWIENPIGQGLTSIVQYGQGGIDYTNRANFSNYAAKEFASKLVSYSDLSRGSSYSQDTNITLDITTGAAVAWCHKIVASNVSGNPDSTYYTPTGRFWTKLASKWVFNKA